MSRPCSSGSGPSLCGVACKSVCDPYGAGVCYGRTGLDVADFFEDTHDGSLSVWAREGFALKTLEGRLKVDGKESNPGKGGFVLRFDTRLENVDMQ